MLPLPRVGFRPSVKKHNVDRVVLCDWIEGSVAFVDDTLSISDVVDVLCEYNIYREQSFAAELLQDAWAQMRRRGAWLGAGATFDVHNRRILRVRTWEDAPAHSFCIMLALFGLYKDWAAELTRDFSKQGELFERLAEECLANLGWTTRRVGWSATQATKLDKLVGQIANDLREPLGNVERWTKKSANEAGLDLVCWKPFPDGRGGKPVYLVQCASGDNWDDKMKTPDIATWDKIIDFSNPPVRGFAMPFTLDDGDFFRKARKVAGMLLDRYRLLSPCRAAAQWPTAKLANELRKWLRPMVLALPNDGDASPKRAPQRRTTRKRRR